MAINSYLQNEDLRNQFINELRNSNRSSAPAKTSGRPTGEILAEKFIPTLRTVLTTFASTNGAPSTSSTTPESDDLSRDDAKKKLIQDIKAWRDKNPGNAKDSVFENASDSEISTILDEWASSKIKQDLGEDYGLYDSEKISDFERKRLNDEIKRIKSDGFFKQDEDFRKEVDAYRDKHYPNSKYNIPANRDAKSAIINMMERGEYTTSNSAFVGMSDYIKNLRNASAKEEPKEEEEYVTVTFEPGDTFGQKIIDAGLATDHGLWGEDGDVAYYARQLDIPNASVINEGDTFRIKKRK